MNLLPMTYFIEVAKQESISRAALRLQITQQTLSTHISSMEQELGCVLFIRRPRFRLTAEGELFLEYCRRFVELDRNMRRDFEEMAGSVTGTIRIGISQSRSAILKPGLIAGFREQFPKVNIRISESTNDELLRYLEQDRLDLIIGDVSGTRPGLLSEELYEERMMLVIPRRPEFSGLIAKFRESGDLRLLSGSPVITNSMNDIVGRYISRLLKENHIPPNIAAISDSAETCLRMCAEGLGIYICPDLYLRYFREIQDRIQAFPLPYSYPIHTAVQKKSRPNRLALRFAGYCREALKQSGC